MAFKMRLARSQNCTQMVVCCNTEAHKDETVKSIPTYFNNKGALRCGWSLTKDPRYHTRKDISSSWLCPKCTKKLNQEIEEAQKMDMDRHNRINDLLDSR